MITTEFREYVRKRYGVTPTDEQLVLALRLAKGARDGQKSRKTKAEGAEGDSGGNGGHEEDARSDAEVQRSLVRDFPDVRQTNHWRCGSSIFTSVCRHFGVEMTEDEASKILGTNVKRSTDPAAIVRELRRRGITARPRRNMTLEDIREATDAGLPVIVCLQDYGNRREAGASFKYGHYMAALECSHGVVIFQDPSIENVERQPGGDVPGGQAEDSGNVAMPGRVVLDGQKFLEVWHDQRANGEKLVRFGIVCGPRVGAVGEIGKDTKTKTGFSDDWNKPPQGKAEWLHRVEQTLRMTTGRSASSFPADVDAIYRSGATVRQAAAAIAATARANYDGPYKKSVTKCDSGVNAGKPGPCPGAQQHEPPGHEPAGNPDAKQPATERIAEWGKQAEAEIKRNPEARGRFKQAYSKVANAAKRLAITETPSWALDLADQWVFEEVLNAAGRSGGVPSAVILTKAAAWGAAKAYLTTRKLVTGKGTDEQAIESIHALLTVVAEAAGVEAPSVEAVQQLLAGRRDKSFGNPDLTTPAMGRRTSPRNYMTGNSAAVEAAQREYGRMREV